METTKTHSIRLQKTFLNALRLGAMKRNIPLNRFILTLLHRGFMTLRIAPYSGAKGEDMKAIWEALNSDPEQIRRNVKALELDTQKAKSHPPISGGEFVRLADKFNRENDSPGDDD